MSAHYEHGLGLISPPANLDHVIEVDASFEVAMTQDRWKVNREFTKWGGAGPNYARGLPAKLCVRPAAMFPVANSSIGHKLISSLANDEVCISHIPRYQGRMAVNKVLEFSDGERRIIRDPRYRAIDSGIYNLAGATTCKRLVVGGSLPHRVIVTTEKVAQRNGIPWAWNPSTQHFQFLRLGLAETADVLQLNEAEASLFVGNDTTHPRDLAKAVHSLTGAGFVILTLGARGTVATNGSVATCDAPQLNGHAVGRGDRHFVLVNWAIEMGATLQEALEFAARNLS